MTDYDSRPVLLGEAPSRGGDRYHAFPLSGRPARVLCELSGIPPEPDGSTYGRWTWALYERFECRNVFERYAAATPWSAPKARDAVAEALPELVGRVVVCLGRRVQAAVAGALQIGHAPPVPYNAWRMDVPGEPSRWVTIPHPSGLNRMLNDEEERVQAGIVLRAALDAALASV